MWSLSPLSLDRWIWVLKTAPKWLQSLCRRNLVNTLILWQFGQNTYKTWLLGKTSTLGAPPPPFLLTPPSYAGLRNISFAFKTLYTNDKSIKKNWKKYFSMRAYYVSIQIIKKIKHCKASAKIEETILWVVLRKSVLTNIHIL